MSEKTAISRRRFLKGAAAAVAVPTIIPSTVWEARGDAAPNSRVNIACIGIGWIGEPNMDAFLGNPGAQVVAICDLDRSVRENAGKKVEARYAAAMKSGTYKGCALYHDFREMYLRDDIDAVMIAVPDHWHAILAVEAAKAGKDLYCEKPLALTIRDGRAIVDAVRRYGRVLQMGSWQRSLSNFRTGCEYVRSGRIGQVREVWVQVGGPPQDCYLPAEPVPDGFDWDFWLGPAPWRPFHHNLHFRNWRPYRDYCGGGFADMGAHHFDIAQWGLGTDATTPVEIIPPDGKEVRNLTFVYANGVKMYHGGGFDGTRFVGTEGTLEVARGDVLRATPASILSKPITANDVHLYTVRGSQQDDFVQCVRTRKDPVCPVEIGHHSASICHLGNIAYALKRPLKYDPVREEFPGDDEANGWLSRPKRAPWAV